ncbi:MAG: APC family permease [Beijerinckiaceae bacterium]
MPLTTLYGLGVTIGAGIYVLVGVTAAKAGIHAPVTFLIAACVVAFTCLTYAELSTRFPVSAGEAEYIQHGFGWRILSTAAGLLLVASGVISSAAISIGAVSYIHELLDIPEHYLLVALIAILAATALWGIVESVTIAALFTLIEISGLGMVIWFGASGIKDTSVLSHAFVPDWSAQTWSGIASGSLLAFFAFVGFEDIVNVAEEVENPSKTLPRAIFLTLGLATLLYVVVVTTMVAAVPMDALAGSKAPLALVFENKPAWLAHLFTLVAIVATVNGILIQMIMASRVVYGLSNQGNLPAIFGYVQPRLQTPLVATLVIAAIVTVLALTTPIARLAELTSQFVLVLFVLVNAALLALKIRGPEAQGDHFRAPGWAPVAGIISGLLLLATSLL